MAFLLPVTTWLPILGNIFDLTSYNFVDRSAPLYDNGTISQFKLVTRINELEAEYMFIDSQSEFRKFLGLDVATNLKSLVNVYDYRFNDQLRHSFNPAEKYVYLLLKVTLKTVNESVPFETSLSNACQLLNKHPMKTHYVKSLVRGYSVFQLLYMYPLYGQNFTTMRENLLRLLGKHGRLDEAFEGKFYSALKESHLPSYGMKRTFGVFPQNFKKQHMGVEDILELKDQFIRIMEANEEGDVLYYEMEQLSSLLLNFPLIDINREIYKQLYDAERKLEDLDTSILLFRKWRDTIESKNELSDEENHQIASFLQGLFSIYDDLSGVIREVDISTLGSPDQFSEALLNSYGNTNITNKYRMKVEMFRRRFESEHYTMEID